MSEKEFSRSKEKGTRLYLFILLNEKKNEKIDFRCNQSIFDMILNISLRVSCKLIPTAPFAFKMLYWINII